jgi:diguanylate cyclase (GGDEF)-like protein
MTGAEDTGLASETGVIRAVDGITWLRGEGARPEVSKLDAAMVLGIPEAELTPKVRAAIAALSQQVDVLRGQLDRSRARIARLERLADEDALVPVANRRAFVRELSRMVSTARRYGTGIAVLYLDIDNMKRVNDTFGHSAGDTVITHVASILLGSVRGSDVVGRLGGDEFGVVLANTNEESARAKAKQLSRTIAATPVRIGNQRITTRITYGVCALEAGNDAQAMIEKADRAMYARKVRHQTPLS